MTKYKTKFNPFTQNLQYVLDESSVLNLDWQESVKDKDLTTPPGSPSTGDRYIVATGGTGAWSGYDGYVTEYNGSSWDFVEPNEGFACEVEDENKIYIYTTSWVLYETLLAHNNLASIQGGQVDEYYHLTSTEHEELTTWLDSIALSSAGGITMSTDIDVGGNNLDNVGIIYGNSTYVRVGDAGTTGHSLSSEDDLLVTGKLEIDGVAYFDSNVYLKNIYSSDDTSITLNLGTDAGDDLIVGNNRLVIEGDTGRIGIGIDNPIGYVEIARQGAVTDVIVSCYHGVFAVPRFTLLKSASNDIGTLATTTNGMILGQWTVRGVDSGNNMDYGVKFEVTQDGIAGATVPANLEMATYSDSAKNDYQLFLHHDGGVGIGTNSPAVKLEISGQILLEDLGSGSEVYSANHAGIFSQSGELWAIDGSGNTTQLSPHNVDGEWIFYSRNVKTGRTVQINMEKVIRKIEQLTDEKFLVESYV